MTWTTLSEGIAQARREMAARERRDIEQEEIADAAGVTVAAYSRWEKGQRIPKEVDVQRLAKFFGVTPAYLRYGVKEHAPALADAQAKVGGLALEKPNEQPVSTTKKAAPKRGGQKKAGGGRR